MLAGGISELHQTKKTTYNRMKQGFRASFINCKNFDNCRDFFEQSYFQKNQKARMPCELNAPNVKEQINR